MKRKAYDPDAADMRTIVPIHNAVNERAWREIKEWEKGRGSEAYVYSSFLFLFLPFPFYLFIYLHTPVVRQNTSC